MWFVVGRESDPVPGDPVRIRELAGRLTARAEDVERNVGRLRGLSSGDGDLRMIGDYAEGFRSALRELPDELAKLGRAFRRCGSALSTFAGELDGARAKAGTALRRGQDAHDRFQGALREIKALLPPDRSVAVASGLSLAEYAIESLTVGLDEGLRAQVRAAARRGRLADADRDLASRLANEAARLRGDAEVRCERGIRDALAGSGIKNKAWWEKAWDWVSTPFRSWDDFAAFCRGAAMVLGIIAMFCTGPLGLVLVLAALAAGAIALANTIDRMRQGKAGWGDLAWDLLAMIPASRGVISLSKLAKTLPLIFSRGGGKLVFAAVKNFGKGTALSVRNVVTAFPHALKNAGGLKGLVTSPRQFAKIFKCRWVGRDPIDMISGEMVMQQTDLELPGVLPFVLQRTYSSAYRAGGWFGHGWSSLLDRRLEVDADGVCFASTEAVVLAFPHPEPGGTVTAVEGPRLELTRTDDGAYLVTDPDTGQVLHFANPAVREAETLTAGALAGEGSGDGESGKVPGRRALSDAGVTGPLVLPLAAIVDRNGNRIELGSYAATGDLLELRHSGGYHLDLDTRAGLVRAIRLRGTGDGEDVEIIRYAYDEGGRLTEIYNSSGRPLRFDYDPEGRMTRWEDRNGTWYRYDYDDAGRVVRTSGSAGCLDGTIAYDPERRVTLETNSSATPPPTTTTRPCRSSGSSTHLATPPATPGTATTASCPPPTRSAAPRATPTTRPATSPR